MQKTETDPNEIILTIKKAQSMKSEINDSKVNAVLKENIGKMYLH